MFTSTVGLVKKRRLNDSINQLQPMLAKRETMCRGQTCVNLHTFMPSPRLIFGQRCRSSGTALWQH